MKVKLNQLICSPLGTFQAGEEVDLPEAMALSLIEGSAAISLEPKKPSSTVIGTIEIEMPVPDAEEVAKLLAKKPAKKPGKGKGAK